MRRVVILSRVRRIDRLSDLTPVARKIGPQMYMGGWYLGDCYAGEVVQIQVEEDGPHRFEFARVTAREKE